jgi:hypothetical protein
MSSSLPLRLGFSHLHRIFKQEIVVAEKEAQRSSEALLMRGCSPKMRE